ncbi:sensor domain-containing diguanylate cyclase [Kineobactrum salinum]|uniref:Diguanylate cyclase n=1 Tax=Kineobactrum salinum TaxID=2708301 RepID=A0A6C0U109_9GAMM|nr:sensor domain-containing diguanylate cyclase [Kineobactrum salinum]QIB65790.1 diguanylate cyclase [Kineobactrum salinum]
MPNRLPEKPLAEFLDLLLDAVCIVDRDARFLFVSAAGEQIFGYTPEEMVGRSVQELVHPDDLEYTMSTASQVMAGETNTHYENRYLRKDGEIVHIMWSARWSEEHQVRIGVARDITRRKRAEFMQSALYAISQVAHTAPDLPALYCQIHEIIDSLTPCRNFYVALYDEDGHSWDYPYYVDEAHPLPPLQDGDMEALCRQVVQRGEPLLLTPGSEPGGLSADERRPQYWLGAPLQAEGRTLGVLVMQSYSTTIHYTENDRQLLQFVSTQIAAAISHRDMLTRLEYMARYDPLTNLPNRELLSDRIRTALAMARREKALLALLFIDLDGFKRINDTLGHAAGDRLLQGVAQRLAASIRESDTAARLGGDEFVVLLERISDPSNVVEIAAKIREAFAVPFELEGQQLLISLSIGAALYPRDGEDEFALLHHADKAMYALK